MGGHFAKNIVMGCLFANILAIAMTGESGKTFKVESQMDDVVAPYCQFKGACGLELSMVQSQLVESEPAYI